MPEHRKLGRALRALWATLAVICLIGTGAAYGATRYVQDELEADARRDAQKLTTDVLRPVLTPRDVADPIRGARYDELLAYVQERVLAGPIVGVRLWRSDGTILFANVESLVGDRDAGMRGDLHSSIAGTSSSTVQGDRFHALTSMRIGKPPTIVTAELIRSHAAIVEESRQRWYPWVARGLTAAAVCTGLYVITAIAFALVGALGRLAKRRKATGSKAPSRARGPAARGVPETPTGETLPAYMRPGFREEFQARQRMAIEMAVAERERDEMKARAHRVGPQPGEAQGQAPSTV
jgi:hypothetical protein